ncbi:MAG TPA: protein-disulfide reductase DsbD, partial [Luteimonas sp.]
MLDPRWWCRPRAAAMAWLLALSALAAPAWAIDEADLLPVDEAFVLTATAPQRDRIELAWRIADGYYLYRHRMSAEVVGGGFSGAGLQLPHGARHTDEFFGEVETFRERVQGSLQGKAAEAADRVTLKVKYQGCADIGVCYPPQVRTLAVRLPNGAGAAPGLPSALPRSGGLRLPGLSRGPASEPLPEASAFGFEAIVGDARTLLLRFTPAPGYYLYRDRSSFRIEGAPDIAPGTPRWPAGSEYHDEYFGDVVVYFDQVDVPLPLRRTRTAAADIRLVATFQGCQTGGICYPPMTRTVALSLPEAPVAGAAQAGSESAPVDAAETATDAGADAVAAPAAPTRGIAPGGIAPASAVAPASTLPPVAEDTRLAEALAGQARWLTLLGFFGAGLLLAFTPCVLPMIPILSGLIAGQGTRLGTGRALLLSFVYVLASALVFTAAGVVAGLVGANLQAAFQQPWILVLFSALFVALALSSFGLYELQLPASLRMRLGAASDRQRGGSLWGVAVMGALSALIVGPCVAPPLAAAVLYISQSQDPVFGGLALFLLAMGMGVPLLFFGVAAGRGMPTSGPWMIAIQRVFGFVFLGVAVWMLSRILPVATTLALWGLLALAAAAWAFSAGARTPRGRVAARFAGLVLAIVGA